MFYYSTMSYFFPEQKPGAILVLHFLDNAHYTPEALDQVLTELENKGSEYRFVGLNKVLS